MSDMYNESFSLCEISVLNCNTLYQAFPKYMRYSTYYCARHFVVAIPLPPVSGEFVSALMGYRNKAIVTELGGEQRMNKSSHQSSEMQKVKDPWP